MKEAYSLRFSRSAETYERWAVPQRESALELVQLVRPRGLILDLGCGTGFVSSFLSEDCRPFGVDISEGMLRVYSSRFESAVLGDAENLPFKDGSFDYVLSNFSLHWTDLSRSVPEALRVARLGVGISVPVRGSLKGIDFPFPEEEEVLEHFGNLAVKSYIKEVPVPFSGWDLVRFFHHTGSSLNPRRRRVLGRREVENLINSIEEPSFRMLFLYARLV